VHRLINRIINDVINYADQINNRNLQNFALFFCEVSSHISVSITPSGAQYGKDFSGRLDENADVA